MRFETDGAPLPMLIDGYFEGTGNDFPLKDVTATVTTGNAACAAHAEMHFTSLTKQVLHHLTTRLPATHHQDRAIWDLGRISIVSGMELRDVVDKIAAPCREIRVLMGPGGDDQIVSAEYTFGSIQGEPSTTA